MQTVRNSRPAPPRSPKPSLTPSPDIESLENMLEPERTGVHASGDRKPSKLLLVAILVLLAAIAAVAVIVLMRR
jgi:hypothetical protein